jgi:hypothetical protein
MSIVARFASDTTTLEQYEQVLRRLQESGDWPPDGLDIHVAFGSPGADFRVSEIWDSREQFEAFGQRLRPLLSEAGIELESEPEVFGVHNIIRR